MSKLHNDAFSTPMRRSGRFALYQLPALAGYHDDRDLISL